MRGRAPSLSRGRPASGRAPCWTRRSMRRGNDRSACSVAAPGITSRGCRSPRCGICSKTPTTRRRRGFPRPSGAPWPSRCCGRSRRPHSTEVPSPRPSSPSCASARARAVLVVVDDVQWLDRPTASALTFAIRRLRDEPVGLILTLRSDGSGQVALGLDRALSPERLQPHHPGAAEPRRAPGDAPSSPGPFVAAAPPAAHPRELGRQSVLRARDREGARARLGESGIRPARSPGPRGVAPGAHRRPSCQYALGPPGCLGVLAAHAGPRRRRNRVGSRGARCPRRGRTRRRDRDPGRTGPVHAPAAGVDGLRGRLAGRTPGRPSRAR